MTDEFMPHDAAREQISALVDGEVHPDEVARTCRDWTDGASLRATWHAYQLIGDVLRSADLASHPDHDAALLRGVRARLACEPVVLAPRAAAARSPARWWAGSAVAAGFVVVVATAWLGRGPVGPTEPAAAMASVHSERAEPVATLAVLPVPTGQAGAGVASAAPLSGAAFVRDARLDRYLQAHQEFAGSSALGVPSEFLRSATLVHADDR